MRNLLAGARSGFGFVVAGALLALPWCLVSALGLDANVAILSNGAIPTFDAVLCGTIAVLSRTAALVFAPIAWSAAVARTAIAGLSSEG
jgi:hypothetical protein